MEKTAPRKWWKIFTDTSRQERLFILFAMLCGFFISMDYGLVRPVSNSVFLSHFSSDLLPYVWLLGLPLNFFLVALYNRYLPRLGCWRVFLGIVFMVMAGNTVATFFIADHSYASLLHFMWKEIYVMLFFQTIWSVIHATVRQEHAKVLYGLMFGVGGCGSVLGSLIPGFFAVEMGSEILLLGSLLTCCAFIFCYRQAIQSSHAVASDETLKRGGKPTSSLLSSLGVIRKSRLLPFILLLVVLMQVSATLIDYQFNHFLQEAYPQKNIRTEFLGRLGSIVSSATVALQFLGSVLLLQVLGLRGTHFLVPLVFSCNTVITLLFPGVGTLAYAFATVKVFDFSLFSVIKEMLYVPLSTEEKFQAKAFIDVFAYRASKAFAAFLILGLQFVNLSSLHFISVISLSLFAIWLWSLTLLFRRNPSAEPLPN